MEVNKEILFISDKIREAVDCERIYLFGSYAYGTPKKDSDLDFYVVLPDDSGHWYGPVMEISPLTKN